MTTIAAGPTTQSQILIPTDRGVAQGDSPAVRAAARTRASVEVTQRKSKTQALARRALNRWWAWTARPPSLRATWRLSQVVSARVPLKSGPLTLLWRISNFTDRPILFALAFLAPTGLQGPLRWMVQRPTRRWAFYLLTASVTAVALIRI